jgi:hypothetical protein
MIRPASVFQPMGNIGPSSGNLEVKSGNTNLERDRKEYV